MDVFFDQEEIDSILSKNYSKSKCFRCGIEFQIDSLEDYINEIIGNFGCYIHPLDYDKSIQEYKCCGASKSSKKMKNFELSSPKGCFSIDHCLSENEFFEINEKPFILIPVSLIPKEKKIQLINDNDYHKKNVKDQFFIEFNDENQIKNNNFLFKLQFNQTIEIDLELEYNLMLKKFFLDDDDDHDEEEKEEVHHRDQYFELNDILKENGNESLNYYKYDEDDNDDLMNSEISDEEEEFQNFEKCIYNQKIINKSIQPFNKEFTKFYLIRRMDHTLNFTKLKEFNFK